MRSAWMAGAVIRDRDRQRDDDGRRGRDQAGRAVLDGLPAIQRHEARQADREIRHAARPEGFQGVLAALQRSGGDERSAAVEFHRHRQRRRARPDHAVGQDAGHLVRGQGHLRAELAAVPAQHRQSRHQVDQGFWRARPHRGALDQGVGAGGGAADGGGRGLRRGELRQARSADGVDVAAGCDHRDAERRGRRQLGLQRAAVPVPATGAEEHPHRAVVVRRAGAAHLYGGLDLGAVPQGQSRTLCRVPRRREGSDRDHRAPIRKAPRKAGSTIPAPSCRWRW